MSFTLGSKTDLGTLLTNVKEELALEDNTNFDFYLERLLKEAIKYTFSMDNVEPRQEVLDIVDKRAKLPCDFILFDKSGGWRFSDNGRPLCNYWYNPISIDNSFFKNTDNEFVGWETVQRVGDYLYFDVYGLSLPTQIEIRGVFLKRNPDGSLFIPEILTRPYVAYACFKFIRSRLGNSQFGFNVVQMQSFEKEWSNGKRWAEAKSKLPDALTKQVLSRIWNALF